MIFNISRALKRIVILVLLSISVWSCQQMQIKPNIIIIMADDQGWGDLSYQGNKDISTPNLDALALDGAAFENFYVSPVCSPTRAALLTGRYHFRSGVYSTSAGGERLNLDEQTIAEVFKQNGYKTALYGKWHSGMQYPYHPMARGFDDFYGFCSGHWGNYFAPELEANGKIVKGKGYVTDDLTQHALDFIKTNKKQPFFLYLSLNIPHSPMQVPDTYWEKFKDKPLVNNAEVSNPLHTRAALAMVANIDDNVGRITTQLDLLELTKNTIIIYLSDNGPNGRRWNAGMKGIKGSTDEGGTRSPLFIQWRNTITPKVVQQLASAVDLLPTLTSLSGISHQSPKPLDGIDLSPWLLKKNISNRDRMLVSYWRNNMSIRNQRYRLDTNNLLYNIEEDRGQSKPLDKKNVQLVYEELLSEKQKYKTFNFPMKSKDKRPFPVGHPDFRWTELPARDATLLGGLKRSNRYPNCTFVTSWTSTQDKVLWPVTVVSSGTFEVYLYYTTGEENVGTSGTLTYQDSALKWSISEAHDPPLVGASRDRSLRMESYTKDFKQLSLGSITLAKGNGNLRIQADNIPGNSVMDLRRIHLKRIN